MKKKITKDEIVKDFEIQKSREISQDEMIMPKICDVPSIPDLLRSQANISMGIVNAYYGRVGVGRPDENWDVHLSHLNNTIYPYEISVYGAYPNMLNWRQLMNDMEISYSGSKEYDYSGINFTLYNKESILL